MASRYLVSSGAWNSTARWSATLGGASGASVPTSADDVFLPNAFSVSLPSGYTAAMKSLDCTGCTGGITQAGLSNMNIFGSATFVSGMTFSVTGTVSFNPTGNATLTTNGLSLATATVATNSSTAVLNLADALTCKAFSISLGTLALGANTLTCGTFTFSTLTGTKAITRSTGNIVLTGTGTVLTWTGTGTQPTFPASNLPISLTDTSGTARTINLQVVFSDTTAVSYLVNGSGSLTFTTRMYADNLVFSGFTGSLVIPSTAANIYGDLTLSAGMTLSSSNTLTFAGTGTITSNGVTLDAPVTVNSASGTISLAGNLTLGSTRQFTLSQGTLSLGTATLTSGTFSSGTSSVRSLNFGTGQIYTYGTVSLTTLTNFSWSGTSNFYINNTASCNYSIDTGPQYAFNVTLAGSAQVTVSLNASFQNLDCSSFSSTFSSSRVYIYGNISLSSAGTYPNTNFTLSGSGTLTPNGATIYALTMDSTTGAATYTLAGSLICTNTLTLTRGTLNLSTYTLTANTFVNNSAQTRTLNFGAGSALYLSGSAATLINQSSTGLTIAGTYQARLTAGSTTGNRTITFNAYSTSNIPPGINDSGTSDVVVANGSDIVNITSQIGYVNLTSYAGTFAYGSALTCFGSFTLPASVTFNTTSSISFESLSSKTINLNGQSFAGDVTFVSGTWTLLSAYVCNATTTLTSGTFDANNYSVTIGSFQSSNTNTRALYLRSGTWTIGNSLSLPAWNISTSTGMTLTAGSSVIQVTSTLDQQFYGGGLTYNVLRFISTGNKYVYGSSTFYQIDNTTQPGTIYFEVSTTQTVTNFLLSGTSGNLISLASTTPGTRFNLSSPSGTKNVSYCSITDSNATGGAVWNSFLTNGNVDGGNNLGWIFSTGGTGNMFLVF